MPYIKLDNNYVDSSLLAEGGFERAGLFFYLCSKADRNGFTDVSVPTVAKAGGITVETCREHLKALAAPDPYSRTPDDEGRRIRIHEEPWGIEIVNYEKYRAKDHTAAERQRRFRQRQLDRAAGNEKSITPAVTGKRRESRKTEDKGQRTETESGEPKVPHTPPPVEPVGAERIAKRFIANFNWCTGRSCQVTSVVVKKVKGALSKGTKGDEILALPFIHVELNSRRRERRTLEPDWILRDGSRGTHDWVSEAMRQAGELELAPRLWEAAEQGGMVQILEGLGLKRGES